jgi:hypothetical protein
VTGANPLDVVIRVAVMLDELAIDYVLGGSLAGSFFGEPRSTADIDVAIRVDPVAGERLLGRAETEFYLPTDSARIAIRNHDSFNLIDTGIPFKVDVFVLGDTLLDRRQLERRILVPVEGISPGLWVTSPEDQVLRKLEWFRSGDQSSDQQWRDISGILRVSGDALDLHYLRSTAEALGLDQLLHRALARMAPED